MEPFAAGLEPVYIQDGYLVADFRAAAPVGESVLVKVSCLVRLASVLTGGERLRHFRILGPCHSFPNACFRVSMFSISLSSCSLSSLARLWLTCGLAR